jgi:hypothetical protein
MISKTCVAPPVGSGSAGTASRTTKRIAKLFFSKSSMRLASVFSPSPPSQPSSCSLTVCGCRLGSRADVSGRR